MLNRILTVSAVLFLCLAALAQKPQKLVFRERVKQLGSVPFSDSTTVLFHYRNEGKQPLTILKVHPGCTCLVPDYSRKLLSPGDSATFTLRYKPSHPGPFSNAVTITYTVEGSQELEIVRIGIKGTATEKPCSSCAE